MADDNAVVSTTQLQRESIGFKSFEGNKMKEKHVNGITIGKNINISSCLDNKTTNGLSDAPPKLNGLHSNYILKSECSFTASAVRDGIKASSLRASPVRNKSMSVPYVNNSKNNHENRLDDNEKKKDGLECKWMDCNFIATDVNQLASHAQETHVDPMKSCDIFVCLWQHCKVFNRPSCSLSWLTKHLESHVGVKPFKCIFEGCQMSFSTQTGLARHVPCHFKENLRQTRKNIGSMEKDESPSKRQLRKKRLKYIRYKKPGSHGKVEDFVDQHSVNSIKSRLQDMISTESNPVGIDGSQIHFVGQPLGERLKPDGVKEILLRWIPESILPDEWVSEKEARTHARRSLPIHRLPNEVKAELHPSFYRRLSHRKKDGNKSFVSDSRRPYISAKSIE